MGSGPVEKSIDHGGQQIGKIVCQETERIGFLKSVPEQNNGETGPKGSQIIEKG
jgi:hypothetical protein